MAQTMHSSRGITLLEILIALAITMILTAITLTAMRSIAISKALDGETAKIVAEIRRARSLTLASKYAQQYGIRIESSRITLFEGSTYSASSATNTPTSLNPSVRISSWSLAGGGSDIIFSRLTGEAAAYGTLTLSRSASSTDTRTIRVYQTGTVELQ